MDTTFKPHSVPQILRITKEHPSGKAELYLIFTQAAALFHHKIFHLPQRFYLAACRVVHKKCGERIRIKCIWLVGVIQELWCDTRNVHSQLPIREDDCRHP